MRKPITSTSQANLEKKIVDFYKQRADTPDIIEKFYPRVLSYKGKETSLANAHENVSRNVRGISSKKFAPAGKKDITEQAYIDDEESQLIEMALSGYEKTKNTAYFVVCLNCTLACRVGEVVALMLDDFTQDIVHIKRQDVKRYVENEVGKFVRNG